MIALQILAAMFGIGCIGAVAYMAWTSFAEGDIGIALGIMFIGLPIGAFLAATPWILMAHERGPDLVTLKKADWQCTQSHQQMTMVMVGKVMVPQMRTICDQYGRS